MSQKRDREEEEMRNRKVPRLCSEELRMTQMLKDLEYFKYNIPPSWEELKEKQDNSGPWDMSDMNDIIKKTGLKANSTEFRTAKKETWKVTSGFVAKRRKVEKGTQEMYIYVVFEHSMEKYLLEKKQAVQ